MSTRRAHTAADAPRRCGSSHPTAGGRSGRRHAGRRACRSPTSSTAARSPRFFLALIERSLTRPRGGLYRWLGEQQAQEGTGASVRPDGYGRYLLADGEITFYLEIDRAHRAGAAGEERSSTPTAKRSPPTRTATAGTSCSSAKAGGDLPTSRAARRPARRGCGAPSTASATRCYPPASNNALHRATRRASPAPAVVSRTASAGAGAGGQSVQRARAAFLASRGAGTRQHTPWEVSEF